jgi:hypothetical protein
MSKQNKVNPGNYTQAGRLSQDDVAREMKKQREVEPPRDQSSPPYHAPAKPPVTDEDKSDEDESTDEQEE